MSEKHTSDEAAKSASKVLRDDRTGDDSKTAAGSALSQKESEKGSQSSQGNDSKKTDKKD